jgi:hypothetical protein
MPAEFQVTGNNRNARSWQRCVMRQTWPGTKQRWARGTASLLSWNALSAPKYARPSDLVDVSSTSCFNNSTNCRGSTLVSNGNRIAAQ